MRTGWIKRIGDLPVERVPGVLRTGEAVDVSKPPICVLHTTQCSWNAALGRFKRELTTPTFMIEGRRIGQLVPLGEAAAGLENPRGGVETNLWTRVQIEIVFTVVESRHRRPWVPEEPTLTTLVALMRMLHEDCDIPLERPFPAEAVMEGILASVDYPRRHSGKWGHSPGYFGHVEVPENKHWDAGNIDYDELFRRAKSLGNVTRTLRIMLPRMTGEDVKEAQRLLEKNPYGNFAPGPVTGTFGLLTAQASARAKRALGYPPDEIVGTFGAALRDYLSGRKKLPPDYQARRLARRAATGFRSPGLEARRDVHPDA